MEVDSITRSEIWYKCFGVFLWRLEVNETHIDDSLDHVNKLKL